MLDLRLEHIGQGQFRTRSRLDYELCCTELDDGEHVRAKVTRRRSVQQNEFFHALIEAAWENQRGGPPQPTWRHLKGWLLIQVGHCNVKRFDAGAMTPAVASYLRQSFETVDFTTDGKAITMKVAKSVSFRRCDAAEMAGVVDRVVELICSVIVPGTTPAEIMSAAKTRAA